MFLSKISIKRPIMMTMLLSLLVVLGVISYSRLSIDLLPDVDFPVVSVITVYPGADPEEIKTQISKKIEDACSSIAGIDKLQSTSAQNVSQVVIQFKDGVDVNEAANDVRDKVELVKNTLPKDAEAPKILKLDLKAIPVAEVVISSNMDPDILYEYIDKNIKDKFSQIDGVADIDMIGGQPKQFHIVFNQDKLRSFNLKIDQIMNFLAANNFTLPAGTITEKEIEYTLKFDGQYKTTNDIENLKIPIGMGNSISLKDVAFIQDNYKERRQLVKLNSKVGILLSIKKRSDANLIDVVDKIRKQITKLKNDYKDLTFTVAKSNRDFIKNSVDDVNMNILIGIILTAITLFIFLHSFKSTLIAAITMPISIIGTYTLINAAGFTLNIMSTMALAISVGLLVNNAIIILENIYRHLNMGKDPKQAANEGTGEIAVAVAGATLTNVVVFLPVAFMEGMVGKFFLQFGLTTTFATFVSLFISYTLTPMLSGLFLKNKDAKTPDKGFAKSFDSGLDNFSNSYKTGLKWTLNNKFITLFTTIVVLFLSFKLAPYIGVEFVTNADEGKIAVNLKLPDGTPFTKTKEIAEKIETILSNVENRKIVISQIGLVNDFKGKSEGVELAQFSLAMDKYKNKEIGKTTKSVIQELRQKLAFLPDAVLSIKPEQSFGGGENPIQVFLKGNNEEEMQKVAREAIKIMKKVPGAMEIDSTLSEGKPEIKIIPDKDKCLEYGITPIQIAMSLRSKYEGTRFSKYKSKGEEYDLNVKLENSFTNRTDNIKDAIINTPKGPVRLYQLAKIKDSFSPAKIYRIDKKNLIQLVGNVFGRSPGEVNAEIFEKLKKLEKPGITFAAAGEEERRQEAFASLLTAFTLAVLFTYMLLAALLESFIHPLTIMMTLPLSFIGVLVALLLAQKTLSIFSIMGVIMLVGIVVNNGILIIEYAEQLREQGKSLNEAIVESCALKLKPILMTAITAVLSMLPLALELGEGGEMRSPMAWVSIGGLLTSTFLSLFVIPIAYTIVENIKDKYKKKS